MRWPPEGPAARILLPPVPALLTLVRYKVVTRGYGNGPTPPCISAPTEPERDFDPSGYFSSRYFSSGLRNSQSAGRSRSQVSLEVGVRVHIRSDAKRMWTSIGCPCGHTFTPIIYEAGSVHMDQHVFDQWSVSHLVWGFTIGFLSSAPGAVAAWKIGIFFVLWELWENVIEVAFSAYAPGEYHGDSLINSIFDMLASLR